MSSVEHTPSDRPFKQKLLPIAYFTSITIAMAGWLWALAWVIYETANWLFV